MPKPGSTVSILSQSRRVRRLTSRTGSAVPTRTASTRLSTRWKMRSSRRAPRPFRSSASQSCADELADIARDGFRRADRLGEGATNLDELRRPNGIDRLAEPSQGLVEAAAEFGTEAQRERRAGLCRQFPDALKTEDAKAVDDILRQAEGGDRQIENRPGALARRDDEDRTRGKTRKRMGGAPAVGERGAGGDARRCRAARPYRLDHGVFAAMQMRRAGNVDDDARPAGRRRRSAHSAGAPKAPAARALRRRRRDRRP